MDERTESFLQRRRLHILILIFLGLLVYSNTFEVPFLFDDVLLVHQRQKQLQVDKITENFALINETGDGTVSEYYSHLSNVTGSPWASRPLLYATFELNQIIGGFNTWGYHIVNIALHIANGVLLYLLVILTGRLLNQKEKDTATLALIASLIFLLHPVQTETVTNIVGRSMLMATTAYLLSLIFFLKAVTSGKREYFIGLLIASVLGAAAREDFATFPVMLLLYDLFFISKFKLRTVVGHYRQFAVVLPGSALVVYLALTNTYENYEMLSGLALPPDLALSPLQYVLTQFKVHWTYIRLLILPVNQNVDYYGYPISRSFFDPQIAISFIGYLGLWVLGLLLVKRQPMAAFGIIWFLVALLPISFVIALFTLRLGDVIFEHRLYLPSVGLIILAAVALMRIARGRKALVPAIVAICIAMGGAAYARNSVWINAETLWGDTLKKHPNNPRAHNNIAMFYYFNERNHEALDHLRTSISLWPDYAQFHSNIGMVYLSEGMLDKAIESLKTALALNPRLEDAYANLGMAYSAKGDLDKALEHFLETTRFSPPKTCSFNNVAKTYYALGMKEEAIKYYITSLWINREQPLVLNNLSLLFLETGQKDRAIKHLEYLVALAPDYLPPRLILGRHNLEIGLPSEALIHLESALDISPNDAEIHHLLAEAYTALGNDRKAGEHLLMSESFEKTLLLNAPAME